MMGWSGLSTRSGILVIAAIACVPAAYRLGQTQGWREGEIAGATATELSIDRRYSHWMNTDRDWLTLREQLMYQHVRPSKIATRGVVGPIGEPDAEALPQDLGATSRSDQPQR
jgi:hypothetical protein